MQSGIDQHAIERINNENHFEISCQTRVRIPNEMKILQLRVEIKFNSQFTRIID